jgi:hypothetical protein
MGALIKVTHPNPNEGGLESSPFGNTGLNHFVAWGG